MKYTVSKSVVDVIGPIWQPGITAAQRIELSGHDVENARDDDGNVTRESLELWLGSHTGDFSGIDDFSASIEADGKTVEIPWADEESEITYNDCMYPDEDGDEDEEPGEPEELFTVVAEGYVDVSEENSE